ncbi:MAG: cell division protein SepF [Bifidobacteriaceae bacterium]|jgi:cell division inhibitor SepF|nr:cell division protein SepF [Bifidobacteriaceae bacterium]
MAIWKSAAAKLGWPSGPEDQYDTSAAYDSYEGYDPEGEMADVTPIGMARGQGRLSVAEEAHRIFTARPRNWDEAEQIGLTFRESVPVVINLELASDADAQRLVDFAIGLATALHGRLKKIHDQVFILAPPGFEVADMAPEPAPRRYQAY